MNLDSIIEKILEHRQDLKRQNLLDLIEKKKGEAQGLLSDEGAARLVAQDLLIKIDGRDFGEVKIADVVADLNDVTLTGRVIVQWPLREFRRQDGTPGKLLKLVLADKTGTIRCALWNTKAEQVATVGELQGRLVRVTHGYTREGLLGEPEVNGGDRCGVTILPSDSQEDDVNVSRFFKALHDVKLGDREVNVIGVIDMPFKVSTFQRNEQEGSVLRTAIADETGTINVVAWDDKVQSLAKLKRGDIIQITSGRVKPGFSASPEVHLTNGSVVSVLKEKPPYLKVKPVRYCKISGLQLGRVLTLVIRVLNVGELREFTKGERGMNNYGSLLVADDTGLVRLLLWDDKAKLMNMIHVGTILLVEGGQAKERNGEIFVAVGSSGGLTVDPQLHDAKVVGYPKRAKIGEVHDFSRPIIVEGTVSGDVELKNVQIASGEEVRVATLIMTDGSGKARVSLWRELAEKASNLKMGMQIKIIGVQPKSNFSGEVTMTSNRLTLLEVVDRDYRSGGNDALISYYI
jgi:replication factor A1